MSDDASALTDQIRAAVADAHQRVTSAGQARQANPGDFPAVDQLGDLMLRQLDAGMEGHCGHLHPRVAQPVHWLPAVPNLWQCDSCAKMLVDEWLRLDYHKCDLCQRSLDGEPAPVLVETTAGMVIIHAVTCAACAPDSGSG